ncbi:MAG: outer membrane beta-barrel protein, partial [Sphingobacteriales bacterium]
MRNKKFIYISFAVLIFLQAQLAHSQNTGSITGKVFEKNIPVELVSVLLYARNDSSKLIKGTITDSAGVFLLEHIAAGSYLVKIQFIGYIPLSIKIHLTNQIQNIDAGIINLTIDPGQLKTVTVTGTKKIIQKTTQGFIVNASANLTQMGGTATDLLRNTPTVVVDAEGAITMRGKTPLLLINGRNSSIVNTDQIPSSSIESVEIINNPSSQYDADAEGGIINIRLKKNKQRGSNGAVALGTGFGAKGRINSSVLLSHKTAKWNYSLAYDNRFAGRIRNIDAERVNFFIPDEYFLLQRRADSRFEQVQNLRMNIDYSPNAKNSLGFEINGNLEGQDNDETLTNTLEKQSKDFNSKTIRHSIEIERSKVAELAFNYSRKYDDKRKSLSASISSSFNYDRENTNISSQSLTETNTNLGDPFLQRTHNYEDANVTNIKTDYVYPVSAKAVIEAGYKVVLRFLDANFQSLDKINGTYMPNPLVSNIFKFNEQVHAAYMQYNAFSGEENNPKWKYSIGIRAEQVWNN